MDRAFGNPDNGGAALKAGADVRQIRPRILLVGGNTRQSRERVAAFGGRSGAQLFQDIISSILPGAAFDTVHPADGDVALPKGMALADYDGAVMSGSSLHVYHDNPMVDRQLALVRAILEAGLPMFGSCWALQVAAVVAGGEVRASPRGREIGVARKLALTSAGRAHPMYAGKAAAFDAPAMHYDEVTRVPLGAEVLAGNGHSEVQALAFNWRGGSFWGVQYHPEFDLRHLACLIRGAAESLVAQGFMRTEAEVAAYARTLEALDADPGQAPLAWQLGLDADMTNPEVRRREMANWVAHALLPAMRRRNRAAER